MATHTWVDLYIPEARLLADLNGIVGDLRQAREYAELLIEQYKSDPPNWRFVAPLSIAMTVAYARAFSGGVRYNLQERNLTALSDPQRSIHQFLRDYGDKHVAHSVNEFEENIARATYCIERVHSEGITGIGYGGGRVVGLDGEKIHGLVEITSLLEAQVRQRIKQEEERLLCLVRSMPLEEVLSGGQKAFRPPMDKVSQARKPPSNSSFKRTPDGAA